METLMTGALLLQLIGPIITFKNGREQRRFEAAKIMCEQKQVCEPLQKYLPKEYRNVIFQNEIITQPMTPLKDIEDSSPLM